MKNRKIILTILTAILLASIFVVSVAAAGAVATTDGKSCAKGSTVTLNVSVDNVSGVYSGAVAVEYDSNILQLVEAKWNTEDVLEDVLLKHYDTEKNKGAFSFAEEKDISGKIFSVTFKVLEDAPIGKSAVNCTVQLKTKTDDISVTNTPGYVDVICNHNYNEKNDQHLASAATCTAPAKYYYTCSLCGKVGSTTYSSGDPLPHTFDQQKTTSDYLVEEVKCVSEAEYYYSCSCGEKGTEKFTADASWSHNYSNSWYVNADNHWHQCSDCEEKKDLAAHTPNDKNICTSCNFQLSTEETHQHSFSENISKDDKEHWYECSCGLKSEVESHEWSEGKCVICDAEDPNYTPDPPTDDPETPENPEKDPDSSDTDNTFNLFEYLLDNIAILLLIVFGIIVAILLLTLLIKDRWYY